MPHEIRLPSDRRDAPLASLRSYVLAWVIGGALAVAFVLLVVDPDGVTASRDLVVLLVVTAVAEGLSLNLRAGDSGVTLSLVETAVVADMLLLGPSEAVVAVVGGIAIQHLVRRIAPMKLAFNVGEHAVGASVAATMVAVAPGTGPVGLGRVLAVGAGVLVYRLLSTRALVGVFTRLESNVLRDQLAERPLELAATTLGNASLGVIAVALWTSYPAILWVVAAPAVALFLSYGSGYRIEELLADVRVERDRLERVVGGVREGIVLLDTDGRVLVWNNSMESLLGTSAAEAVGQRADALLSGVDDHGTPVDPLAVLADDGQASTVEVRVDDYQGQMVPVRMLHRLLRNEAGRCTGDVIVVHDLAREREAAALKEDFVARVSHELRTPLSPLRAYAQSLRRAGDRVPVEKRGEILDQMVERVDHLARLVDDLLLVSQIGAGRVDPAREVQLAELDLAALVPRLVTWLGQEHTRDHAIEVVGADAPLVVMADQMRTGQIVTNLLTNACKYSDPGAPVTVRLAGGGDDVTVVVEDRGPGIPPDKLEAIFERFERLDDPQRMQAGGIGLGLYISRHLAEAMGGRLTVASTRGVGTAFTLALPSAPADLVPAAVPAARPG